MLECEDCSQSHCHSKAKRKSIPIFGSLFLYLHLSFCEYSLGRLGGRPVLKKMGTQAQFPCAFRRFFEAGMSLRGRSRGPTQEGATETYSYKLRRRSILTKRRKVIAALSPCIVVFTRIRCKRPATVTRRGARRITKIILCGARECISILNQTLQGAPEMVLFAVGRCPRSCPYILWQTLLIVSEQAARNRFSVCEPRPYLARALVAEKGARKHHTELSRSLEGIVVSKIL